MACPKNRREGAELGESVEAFTLGLCESGKSRE